MDKEITVFDLLREHMQFLAIKAAREKGEKQKAYIEAMDDIQVLMNRLGSSDPDDEMLSGLMEQRMFLALSYDTKVLVLEHTKQIVELRKNIMGLINFFEQNPQVQKKLIRSFAWRLLKLFGLLPWGFKPSA